MRGDPMTVLLVDPDLPAPPTSGGRVRAFHLIREVARRHDVDVVAPALPEPEAIAASRQLCRKLWLFQPPVETRVDGWRRRVRSVVVGRLHHPRPEVQATLHEALTAHPYDVLHFLTPYLIPSIAALDARAPVLVDFLGTSIGVRREVRQASGVATRLARVARWSAAVRGERWVLRHVDGALAISEDDRRYLARLAPRLPIHVVPNGVDADHFAPLPEAEDPRGLVFVGDMSFGPNVDAACYFARTILPRLRARVADVRVAFVGRAPALEVRALSRDPAIAVTGAVPDVRPYVARAAVVVIPLRGGSGVRNKTLEAMAMGRAIVTTPMGVEGLEVTAGRELVVTDDPERFAQAVAKLLGDPDRRRAMGEAARARVLATYGWDASARRLEAVYAELRDARARAGRC